MCPSRRGWWRCGRHTSAPSVQEQRTDPTERLRVRRDRARRVRRRRRVLALAVLLVLAAVAAALLVPRGGGHQAAAPAPAAKPAPRKSPAVVRPRPLPDEIRGVHVTMSLASLPGRLEQY